MAHQGIDKEISLGGIVRNTSGSVCPDGEMEELINLRPKDGSFRPTGESMPVRGLEDVKVDYTNIVVHSCGYRHLLGVKDGRLYYFANQDETNTVSMLTIPIELMDVSGEPKYSQTGNLLSVIDDTGIKYLLWEGNKYKEASMDFNGSPTDTVIAPLDVSFRMTPEMGKDEDNIDRQIIHAYVEQVFKKDGLGSFELHEDIAARNELFVPKYLEALYRHREKGYPVGYFFICAVAELYDGTKVLQTNPQLITIGNDKGTRYNQYTQGESYNGSLDSHQGTWAATFGQKKRLYKWGCVAGDGNSFIYNSYHTQIDSAIINSDKRYYREILSGSDNFSHYYKYHHRYSYGGYGSKTNGLIQLCPNTDVGWTDDYAARVIGARDQHYGYLGYTSGDEGKSQRYCPKIVEDLPYVWSSLVHNNFGVFFPASKLQYRINGVKNLDNTLFRKIHFYITEPIEPVKSHSLSDVFYTLMTKRVSNNEFATAQLTTFEFNELTQKELELSLLNQKIFYKIKELEFSKVQKGGWIDLEFKDNILNNLKTNCEQLNLDAINRSSFVPKVAYSYNGRLHLANYSEKLFSGYPINYFFDERTSEANTQYAPYKCGFDFPNNGNEFAKSKAYMKIVVHLKTEDGYKQVTRYRTLYGHNTFINNISVRYPYSDLMPFICYPDRRAERLDVYVATEDDQTDIFFETFNLTPHAHWDVAYYINDWFKPINCLPEDYYPHPESYSTDDLFDIPTTNELSSVTYGNKIRVSAVDNPIYFPYKNTYQIGNAEILALSSNTIALSEGQVGDAPLIVFASDGIYGLFVDATGQMTYTNSRPLARDILNNAKSVTPTDFGVVFTTDRGLMIISGVEVQEMSEKVEGDFFDFTNNESFDYLAVGKNAVSHKELVLLSDSVTKTEFKQYISGAKIGYNFNEYEIVLSNNNYSYSYIYSLRYKLWYKRTGSASEFVNDYPNMYFLDNGTLYDINRDDTTKSTQTMFLSRPIKFNTQDFKQAFRSIIRGLFHLPKKENSGNIHELVVTSDDLTPTVRDIVLTEKAFDKTITLTPFECTFREIELVAPTLSKRNYASGEVDTHTFEEVDGVITPSSVRLYVDSCYTIIKGSDEKMIVNTGLHNPVIMEQLEVTVIDDFSDISSPNDGDMFIMQTSLLRWDSMFNDIIDCYYKDFTYHLTNEGATHDEGTYHWYNNEKKMYQVVNSVEVEVQMDNSSYWKDGDLFYQFYQPDYIDMSYEEIISAVNYETLETYSPIEPGGGKVTSLRLTKGNCYKVVKYNTTNTKETYTFKFTGTTNLYPIIDVLSVLSGINTESPLVGSFIDVPLYASETITGLTNGECVRIKTNGATVCEFIYSSNATSINNLTLLDNYRSGIYDEIPPVADVENLVVNGKLLLKSGENVFITDETGDTPIVYKFVYYGEYGIYYYDLMMRIGLNRFDEIHPIEHTPIELKQDEYIHLSVSYNNGAEREAYFKYLITESPIPLDDLLLLIDTNSTSEVLVYSSPSAIPLNTDKLLRIVCGKTILFRDVNNNEYLFSAKKGNNKSFFRSYADLLYILQNHCTPSGYLDTSGMLWKTEEDAGLKYRAGIYLFGSYDCRKWTYIGGNERGKISGINGVPENSEENITDVYNVRFRDLGALTERVDFKFFRILFVGNLIGDSSIEYIDMSVSGRLLSQKLR